jgi:restriction system protein
LESEFRIFHERRKQAGSGNPDFKNLSGVDFEVYLAKVLKENGFEDVCGTSATRDQGADLIAKKGNKKIVIQAKCWQAPVGNAAVQEIIGAVGFYHADEGWVITNSTFTPDAKTLAQKNNVKLIDGHALRNRQLT